MEFLSSEWFAKVDELTQAAGDLQMPKSMTDVTANLTVKTDKGNVEMCVNGGIIQKGFIDNADVTFSMPAKYAYKMLILNDWSQGMKGYMKRHIKLSGDMKKLGPLLFYKPSQPTIKLCNKIAEFTDFKV